MRAERAGTLAGAHDPETGLELAPPWRDRWEGSGEWRCILDGALYGPVAPDAEAVARGWEKAGEAFLRGLRGEFTLLLWNESRRRGVLACDRGGARTAFFHDDGGRTWFGAELGPLLDVLPRRPAPDPRVVAAHLASVNTRDGLSLFEGVRQLGQGALLELGAPSRAPRRYFEHRPEPVLAGGQAELAHTLRDAVARAVTERAPAGAPTAASLSGGLDSSSVTAIARWARGREDDSLRTYSAVFPGDERMDESGEVLALRDALGLSAVGLRVAPTGLLRCAVDYIRDWHSPVEGPGYLLDAPLMEAAAADGMEVVIDGQGGDETFAAPAFVIADRLRRLRLASALGLARQLPRYGAFPGARTAMMLLRHYGARALVPPAVDARLARRRGPGGPAWLTAETRAAAAAFDQPWAWKRLNGPRWWANSVDAFVAQREVSGLADYARRRAASAGLVARPPLMDPDLAALVLRLPPESGFDTRFNRALIRAALEGLAPDSVRLRARKTNLGSFYHRALLADLPALRELLDPATAHSASYTEAGEVRALTDAPPGEGDPGWLQWTGSVWTLANVELWLRVHAGGQPADRLADDLGLTPIRAVSHFSQS